MSVQVSIQPDSAGSSVVAPTVVRLPQQVGALIKASMAALEARRWAEAIELAAAAAVCDIQEHQLLFLSRASEAALMGELLERGFAGAAANGCANLRTQNAPLRRPVNHRGGPLRVLYIAPSLTPGQAAAERLVNVVESHDRSTVQPLVLVADEFTQRTPAGKWLEFPHFPSREAGAGLIARLERAGVSPEFVSTTGDYLRAAEQGVALAREHSPDVAVFIASPACPIQAGMALARVAPIQINQNIGAPLLIRGIDACLYRNPAAAATDKGTLDRLGIRSELIPAAGIDLESIASTPSADRTALGIPDHATVLVSVSNRLPRRLDPANESGFGQALCRFLRANPTVWWLGIGPGDFNDALRMFTAADVRNRVILTGGRHDVPALLKAADIYINEYPEGGSNTVLEAMACALPVAAINAGDAHTWNIGASIIGDAARPRGDTEGYWHLVAQWCRNTPERQAVGKANLARAQAEFGVESLCRSYERIYKKLFATQQAP